MTTKFLSIKEVVEPIVGGYWGETVELGAGNARVVRNGDVLESGEIGSKVPERKLSEKEIAKSKLQSGDILITMSGNVGRVARVKNKTHHDGNPYVASNFVKILRAKKGIMPEYLFFLLRDSQFQNDLKKYTRGVAIQNLSVKVFDQKIIPYIAEKEQERIVALLEEAEELKRKRAEADQKMTTVIPALFNKMFGENESYEMQKLGDSITFMTSGARGWAKFYSDLPGFKYIRIQNVKKARLNFNDVQYVQPPESAEFERIKVQEGDLLISMTADLGRTAVVDKTTAEEGAFINQHIGLVRLDSKYNPLFVAHYLENNGKYQFDRYGQAATKKGMNFDSIKSLRVPRPPLELQNKFVERANELITLENRQKASAVSIEVLFRSLLNRAFVV